MGKPAYLVSSPREIKDEWFQQKNKIGITSGASTPEIQVQSILQYLSPRNIYESKEGNEDVVFTIPRQLRFLIKK